MKNLNIFLIGFLTLFASIALLGCASKPADELEMAQLAMNEAIDNQASEYAPYDWDRAQMNWQMANALIRMGRYDEAREILVKAVGNFNKARDLSSRRLESLKIEINGMLPVLKKEVALLRQISENPQKSAKMRRKIEEALPIINEKVSSMNA